MITFVLLLCLATLSSAILGGHDAPDHKHPYLVSVRQRTYGIGQLDQHLCSGMIINEQWILTTATCLRGINLNDVVIVAGTNYLKEAGYGYRIQIYIKHKNFEEFHHDNIALIRVVGKIVFNEHVSAIKLPTQDVSENDTLAEFAGWGHTRDNPEKISNVLQEIELPLITNEECENIRKNGCKIEICKTKFAINGKHICTSTKDGKGRARADASGPLIIDDVLIGISSYFQPPGGLGHPDIYTRVFNYLDWIKETQKMFERTTFADPRC